MNAVVSHPALLRHDDVMRASMAARSRNVSVNWLLILLMAGLIAASWAGNLLAFWLVQQLSFPVMFAVGAYVPVVVPALIAFYVVLATGSMQNWVARRAYLRNFRALSIPTQIDALFEIMPEGLRLTTERIVIFPRWQAIDQIEQVKLGWVVSADQLTFLIPADSFADAAAERTFIYALADRLPPEARTRSTDVDKLASLAEPSSGLA